MRFRVEPGDVPSSAAAKRMGMSTDAFEAALPNLVARGFPVPDPDTRNFDLDAIDRWRALRHPHLFAAPLAAEIGARDAGDVVGTRLAALRKAANG